MMILDGTPYEVSIKDNSINNDALAESSDKTSHEPIHNEIMNNEAVKDFLEENVLVASEPESLQIQQSSEIEKAFVKRKIIISSPMSGKVVLIKALAGDAVRKGDPLIVIEAMKMENEIISPIDGSVINIFVNFGDYVELSHNLISIEYEEQL